MKTFIAAIAALTTLAAAPAFADDTSVETNATYQLNAGLDTRDQQSGAIVDRTDEGRVTSAPVLPAGSALGQGPASVSDGVPAGTHAPAIGAGGVINGQ